MPIYVAGPQHLLGDLPKIDTHNIPYGFRGNVATINMMTRVAQSRKCHPLVQRLAQNIVLYYSVASNDYANEAAAIGDFVKENVRYLRDPQNVEQLQDPINLIRDIESNRAQGDCDDQALLTATLLLAIGHNPVYRAVRYERTWGHFDHIYVVDYERNWGTPEHRVVLDAILKRFPIGREVGHKSGKEYPI